MRKCKRWALAFVFFPIFLLDIKFGIAQSQTATAYSIRKDVVDQGGAASYSARFKMVDAIGQPGVIGKSTGNSYRLSSGFLSVEAVNPVLLVLPETLDFGTTLVSMSFQIKNAGAGNLDWTITENPDETWIKSISPISGINSAAVNVTIDRDGLKPGDYSGNLLITSNGGDQQVNIKMTVSSSENNMLLNGDFSNGDNGWILTVLYPAQSTGAVEDGEYVISITNGGNYVWDINLKQINLTIQNKKTYRVKFDAYTSSPRQISAIVGKNSNPWTVYSGDHFYNLSTTKKTYSYSFTMNDPTDHAARIGFDVGLSTANVYFDNVTLIEDSVSTALEHNIIEPMNLPTEFKLLQNYPNPFNPSTTIRYSIPKSCHVCIKVYNIMGEKIQTLYSGYRTPGSYNATWNATDYTGLPVSAGIYIYHLQAADFSLKKKMLLLK